MKIQAKGRVRTVAIVGLLAVAGYTFVSRSDEKAQAQSTTAEAAAQNALSSVAEGIESWRTATGTVVGAPHNGVSLASGVQTWGVSTHVKWSGGVSCAIAGTLDGRTWRISVAENDEPCSKAGVDALQTYICQTENLNPCPVAVWVEN
jgi:hypothetical protein